MPVLFPEVVAALLFVHCNTKARTGHRAALVNSVSATSNLRAMFDPSKLFAGLTGRKDNIDDRSRSPVRVRASALSQHSAQSTHDDTPPPVGTTGIPACDEWLLTQVRDRSVLTEFAQIPIYGRKRITLKCIETPPDDAVRWLSACIRNQKRRSWKVV